MKSLLLLRRSSTKYFSSGGRGRDSSTFPDAPAAKPGLGHSRGTSLPKTSPIVLDNRVFGQFPIGQFNSDDVAAYCREYPQFSQDFPSMLNSFSIRHTNSVVFKVVDDGPGQSTPCACKVPRSKSISMLFRHEIEKIWAFIDSKEKGCLDLEEFITAMQLISLVQEVDSTPLMDDLDFLRETNFNRPSISVVDEYEIQFQGGFRDPVPKELRFLHHFASYTKQREVRSSHAIEVQILKAWTKAYKKNPCLVDDSIICFREAVGGPYHSCPMDCDGRFFYMPKLSRRELEMIWVHADSKGQGYLGLEEFITAMQLIALVQERHDITPKKFQKIVNMNLKSPSTDLLTALRLQKYIKGRYYIKQRYMKGHGIIDDLDLCDRIAVQQRRTPSGKLYIPKSAMINSSAVTSISDGLKRLYAEKLKPLEVAYCFSDFSSPAVLTNSDFDYKPMIMLWGQSNAGKTTLLNHLLKYKYPGTHIGPEPTTDRFVVMVSGPDERSVPGYTIAADPDMPFGSLTSFGGDFLSNFECLQMPRSLLEFITFVDTPEVLQTERIYDFTGITSWFAAKCDLILLLFDPLNPEISDEFKQVISSLRGHRGKIRIVLNNADQVDTHELIRFHRALMWSLGEILGTLCVYNGSFNDKPVHESSICPIRNEFFEKEQDNLLTDLIMIGVEASDHKIKEFMKRARAVKIHACIISQLRKEMPTVMGKAKDRMKLIDNLDEVYLKVQKEFHFEYKDFPCVEHYKEVLSAYNLDAFETWKPDLIQQFDDMLVNDIPQLQKNLKKPRVEKY